MFLKEPGGLLMKLLSIICIKKTFYRIILSEFLNFQKKKKNNKIF
jgi:hypothetical protein